MVGQGQCHCIAFDSGQRDRCSGRWIGFVTLSCIDQQLTSPWSVLPESQAVIYLHTHQFWLKAILLHPGNSSRHHKFIENYGIIDLKDHWAPNPAVGWLAPTRSGCPGPCLTQHWRSPRMWHPQLLRAACSIRECAKSSALSSAPSPEYKLHPSRTQMWCQQAFQEGQGAAERELA